MATLVGALPLSLLAQVRRPDPVPAGSRSGSKAPKKRTELYIGGGTIALDKDNATKASMPVGAIGLRHQLRPQWLFVGAVAEYGKTTIDGQFFPYEKRVTGDTTEFVAVGGNATMVAGRITVDGLFAVDEAKRFHVGAGLNGGLYQMSATPVGSGTGSFVAPTFGAALLGQADVTARLGVTASLGFTQFTNYDREKLRPSDPAKEDPVITTPFSQPPAAVKSFGGPRLIVGVTYRFGVKKVTKGRK